MRSATCLTIAVVGMLSLARGQESEQLSTVVASERYDQQEFRLTRGRMRNSTFTNTELVRARKLESDVAFLRLPGGASWMGVRDVRTVDGKAVTTDPSRLLALVKRFRRDSDLEEAAGI